MKFNLTEKRIETLRWLASRPEPVYVCAIAYECLPRPLCAGRPLYYWPQQATRTGAGYARPLAEAGLVRARIADVGWSTVEITEAGRRALAAFDRDDGTLERELEMAREAAERDRCYWWRRKT